jgi:hypothetical protein
MKSVISTFLFKNIRFIWIVCAIFICSNAHSEPVNRSVSAEFVAGFDFSVFHQQGDEVFFKFNDHSADFTTRFQNPAKFNFNIRSSRETLNECSIHFITWEKQETELAYQQRVGRGLSLDQTYRPGLAGVIASDKTVHTGDGHFKVSYSSVTADFFSATKGDPVNPNIYEEILSSRLSLQNTLKIFQLDDYPFQEYFTTIDPNQNLAWLNIQGAWTDKRYVVFSLPCSAIITLPVLDETPPTVSFSPAELLVNADKSATSELKATDDIGLTSTPEVQCTNGGTFNGSTFTAPNVTQNTTSICTATVTDEAGNTGSGTLIVSMRVKPEPPEPPKDTWINLGLALLALALITIIALRIKRRAALPKNSQRFFKRSALTRPKKPHKDGVVFPQSPLLAGAVAPGPAPLVPAGQMIPSGLQTLSGQYAALKPAYLATGRIGGPQDGIPTNDDVSFGTGFLITPDHIMTNQHVYEFYKHYLTGPDCGGIEFIAERDRDASDYVPFNGNPPLILPDLDIAIFTLARSVTARKPIKRIAIPTEELSEREVITVSYPCPFEVDEHILSSVEEDPIFAVKRISQGHIFRHSTDTDTPFGVQVTVDERINAEQSLSAICHNASTLSGSSGAPILDKSGNLVGVHFAGDRAFNGEEAANLAMAIEMLAHINPTTK